MQAAAAATGLAALVPGGAGSGALRVTVSHVVVAVQRGPVAVAEAVVFDRGAQAVLQVVAREDAAGGKGPLLTRVQMMELLAPGMVLELTLPRATVVSDGTVRVVAESLAAAAEQPPTPTVRPRGLLNISSVEYVLVADAA